MRRHPQKKGDTRTRQTSHPTAHCALANVGWLQPVVRQPRRCLVWLPRRCLVQPRRRTSEQYSSRARGGINTPARSKRKRTGADDSRPQSTPHDKTATEEPVLEDDEDAPIHRSIEALVQSPDDVRKDSSFKEFDQLLLSDETRNWARKLYIYPLECARGVRRRWPWTRTRLVAKRGARHGQDGPGPGVSGRG